MTATLTALKAVCFKDKGFLTQLSVPRGEDEECMFLIILRRIVNLNTLRGLEEEEKIIIFSVFTSGLVCLSVIYGCLDLNCRGQLRAWKCSHSKPCVIYHCFRFTAFIHI